MKYLHYTCYCEGDTGLSNTIMSIELGVVLAHLTDRVLLLQGNRPPLANLVSYGGRVKNTYPCRVTDLLEMPVPWLDVDSRAPFGPAHVLTDRSLLSSVFYFPAQLDLETDDFRAFSQNRPHTITCGEDLERVDVVSLEGGPPVGHRGLRMGNFGNYAPFFYLDADADGAMREVLKKMKPKAPYQGLADRVARELGSFNALHIRRGDFKQTYGRTTLLRRPAEVIEYVERNFPPYETLVILTDEQEDPFFEAIVRAFPGLVFLDQHLLDHYADALSELPYHDRLALAFVGQLVATHANDFAGTMTSTFTSLIQRWRGSLGRPERFKFLWNELPAPDAESRRGDTAINDRIPMNADGTMKEEREGPYSWNRYDPRLNSGWMREWPEAFLRLREDTP